MSSREVFDSNQGISCVKYESQASCCFSLVLFLR